MDFAIAGEQNKFVAKRPSVTKIEDRLVNFELKSSTSENSESMTNGTAKKDLPKVDINKRRELFEKEGKSPEKNNRSSGDFSQQAPLMSIKQRLSNLERQKEESNVVVQTNRLSGDVTSIKDRLKNLEKETTTGQSSPASKVEIPLSGSIKDRLSSLHSSVSTTAATAPVVVATEEPLAANGKGAIVVGVAKKPWSASDVDQVIEVETLNIEVEQLKLSEPESLMTMDSIQDAVQDYVTIVQDVKVTMSQTQSIREKEEYREITDEDLFGGTDIDMDADADVEIDNLQQDMSVSSTTETVVSNSILINEPHGAGSLEDVSQGSLRTPENGINNSNGDQVTDATTTNGLVETLTALDNLLKRSTSNNNLNQQVCNNYQVVVNSWDDCVAPPSRSNTTNQSSINNNLNPQSSVVSPMPKSVSENSIAKLRNLAEEKNPPLRSSQSEFFNAKRGDRHCVLLIDNSRR